MRFSPIVASAYRFWARVEAKAWSLEARARAMPEAPVIMSPIALAPRAASLLSLNRLPIPRDLLDRVCPVPDEALLPRNSRQRKRECWREDKVAGGAHNAPDVRRGIHWSVSTDEREGGRSSRKTWSPNSGTH